MATNAGEMTQTPPGDPQWVACNGAWYYGYATAKPDFADRPHAVLPSRGNVRDWHRRVRCFSGTRGIGGWLFRVPRDPGATWYISRADDSGETALVANITTTTTGSVAAAQTVIPVTSATGFVVGLPIAATGIAPGATIALIAGLNITINPATTGIVASGATVTVTPAGPATPQHPPAGVV